MGAGLEKSHVRRSISVLLEPYAIEQLMKGTDTMGLPSFNNFKSELRRNNISSRSLSQNPGSTHLPA